jgi:hypothetical protein
MATYTIHYLTSRESDRSASSETIDALSVEAAAQHARSQVGATRVSSSARRPDRLTGFLIFDAAGSELLHREYLFPDAAEISP